MHMLRIDLFQPPKTPFEKTDVSWQIVQAFQVTCQGLLNTETYPLPADFKILISVNALIKIKAFLMFDVHKIYKKSK